MLLVTADHWEQLIHLAVGEQPNERTCGHFFNMWKSGHLA